uniref:Uncharacterized protein n=1 Tax=Siphoviridae sp. ctBLh2 TaxID=2827803 RepID=A0A8S5S384_9CAUD|nr:MAG TPA: hypothetical protein [Siphoviridae sp. ctBLh2]
MYSRPVPVWVRAFSCYSRSPIRRMIRAGTPPTIVSAGTSFVTTAPAATMALSPIVTPLRIVAWAPTQTFRPRTIGAGQVVFRRAGSIR